MSYFFGLEADLEVGNISGGVSGIVVVHVAEDGDFLVEQFLDWGYPMLDVGFSIDDDLIEDGGDFLNTFSISKPSNVYEGSGVDALVCEELFWGGHPGAVDEGECVLEVAYRWECGAPVGSNFLGLRR